MITRNGKHTNGAHILDGMPQTLVHGVAKGAGQAGGAASEISDQIRGRVAKAPLDMKEAKLHMSKRKARIVPTTDAMVKAQLAKTSRDLAHESSDIGTAIESLNKVIKANRRAGARSRSRLLSGLALGAALMYHLDSEHGRERRAATARMLTGMVRGQRDPHPPVN